MMYPCLDKVGKGGCLQIHGAEGLQGRRQLADCVRQVPGALDGPGGGAGAEGTVIQRRHCVQQFLKRGTAEAEEEYQ